MAIDARDHEFIRNLSADDLNWVPVQGEQVELTDEQKKEILEAARRDLENRPLKNGHREDEGTPDLAYTVEQQAAQIARVREVLRKIGQADKQAQHDWDTNCNPFSQHEALAYSMVAQWLEEALGDMQ